jgi:ribosomal protein S3
LRRELSQDGYSAAEVKFTPMKTKITITESTRGPRENSATQRSTLIGEGAVRIKQIAILMRKRFNFLPHFELFVPKTRSRDISALGQAEIIRYELLKEHAINQKRVMKMVIRNIERSGARGCEVTISGKMGKTGSRAKTLKERQFFHDNVPVMRQDKLPHLLDFVCLAA